MDLICRICGEPWDMDTFHEVADEQNITFSEAVTRFRVKGCVATGWCGPCTPPDSATERERNLIAGEIMDLLGDDVDGAAAMLEDFGLT